MKKAPSPAKKAAPAVLSDNAEQKLRRFALLLALIAPLADTLVIFPLRQIILANSSGTGVLYQLFFQLTELLNLAAFFLLLALAIYCAISNSTHTLGRILALHGISSVFIVILLRMAIFYLLAWLDSGLSLPFELCNQTLNTLTRDSGAEMMSLALSLFLSQVILFVILLITALFALRRRQKALEGKADLSPLAIHEHFDATPLPGLLKLGLILYGLLALVNQVADTLVTLLQVGVPGNFDTLLSLIVPYFLFAIYCLLGYLALEYGARYFARQCAR